MPRQAVAHRADLAADLVAAIEAVLLMMDQDEQGRQVFDGVIPHVSGFASPVQMPACRSL